VHIPIHPNSRARKSLVHCHFVCRCSPRKRMAPALAIASIESIVLMPMRTSRAYIPRSRALRGPSFCHTSDQQPSRSGTLDALRGCDHRWHSIPLPRPRQTDCSQLPESASLLLKLTDRKMDVTVVSWRARPSPTPHTTGAARAPLRNEHAPTPPCSKQITAIHQASNRTSRVRSRLTRPPCLG
jgi:hypothetical protein